MPPLPSLEVSIKLGQAQCHNARVRGSRNGLCLDIVGMYGLLGVVLSLWCQFIVSCFQRFVAAKAQRSPDRATAISR